MKNRWQSTRCRIRCRIKRRVQDTGVGCLDRRISIYLGLVVWVGLTLRFHRFQEALTQLICSIQMLLTKPTLWLKEKGWALVPLISKPKKFKTGLRSFSTWSMKRHKTLLKVRTSRTRMPRLSKTPFNAPSLEFSRRITSCIVTSLAKRKLSKFGKTTSSPPQSWMMFKGRSSTLIYHSTPSFEKRSSLSFYSNKTWGTFQRRGITSWMICSTHLSRRRMDRSG